MTINVLMVAEKPSICTSIAQALSHGNMTTHGRSPPVHEFSATFLNKPACIRVISVTGHVFSVDFPKSYQNWDTVKPEDLFSAPILSMAEGKGGIIKHLEREAKNMDYLVLWLDCDREGENICFEVIRCVEKHLNQKPSFPSNNLKFANGSQNVFRAKFSSVTPKDIEKAMSSLGSPNENESLAVEARQELDLKGKYGDLDSTVISYGPCQTPTLGFCVERHDEIQSFTAENFWTIDVSVDVNTSHAVGKMRHIVPVEWSRGRLFDQSVTDSFIHLIHKDSYLICDSIKSSETRKTRPIPMNTVEMLKSASSRLGIGPHSAMKLAEELYLSGYLSYPRTESTSYPKSYDIRETLLEFRNSADYGEYVSGLLKTGITPPRSGVDMGDHPPITPVNLAVGLVGDTARLYEMIVRHFLATVSDDAIYLSTKVICRGTNSGELFTMNGRREISPGFLSIISNISSEDRCVNLPDSLCEGQQFQIIEVKSHCGKTSAPGYLTESDLIGLMEKNGIGTDASIATHINNILVRNYVTIGSGRTLVPTNLGVVLVHGYLRIDPALVLPEVRATIEQFCNMIAKGEASKDQVVNHSLTNFLEKFQYFCANINHMDSLFEASFSPLAQTGKFLSRCGKCLRYMRFIPLKPQRLYCPNCEDTYSLPQNGTIKLYKEYKCPLDKFELVLYSLGNTEQAQGKSYPLCPYCYNFPPNFESLKAARNADMQIKESKESSNESSALSNKTAVIEDYQEEENADDDDIEDTSIINNMGCDSCMHPSCKHSAFLNGICQCPGANASGNPCKGMLVLDVNSKPNWKLSCNRCNTILRFRAELYEITPLVREECTCGTRMLKFEFSTKAKALPNCNNDNIYKGCIMCDDFLNSKTEILLGRTINLQVLRQLRHRKGVAGRGRGRGRRAPRGDPKMTFDGF